ncbi:hypothetical protein MMPV_009936 [Pyropia vietnamensis]
MASAGDVPDSLAGVILPVPPSGRTPGTNNGPVSSSSSSDRSPLSSRVYREVVKEFPLTSEPSEPELLGLWRAELGRAVLTGKDRERLELADQGLNRDGSSTPPGPGSAWFARLSRLPLALVRQPDQEYDPRVCAPVIRWPAEDQYPFDVIRVWDSFAGESSAESAVSRPPAPDKAYIAIQPPFLGTPLSASASPTNLAERRARLKGFLVSCHQQDFWRINPSERAKMYPRTPAFWFNLDMEVPTGFAVPGSPFLWYCLDALLEAGSNYSSIPFAIYFSEVALLVAVHWVEECRLGNRFWLLPQALMVWVTRLPVDFLSTGQPDHAPLLRAMHELYGKLPRGTGGAGPSTSPSIMNPHASLSRPHPATSVQVLPEGLRPLRYDGNYPASNKAIIGREESRLVQSMIGDLDYDIVNYPIEGLVVALAGTLAQTVAATYDLAATARASLA